MGPGFGANMDFGLLFWFAGIGFAASALAVLGAIGWLIWLAFSHLAFV